MKFTFTVRESQEGKTAPEITLQNWGFSLFLNYSMIITFFTLGALSIVKRGSNTAESASLSDSPFSDIVASSEELVSSFSERVSPRPQANLKPTI